MWWSAKPLTSACCSKFGLQDRDLSRTRTPLSLTSCSNIMGMKEPIRWMSAPRSLRSSHHHKTYRHRKLRIPQPPSHSCTSPRAPSYSSTGCLHQHIVELLYFHHDPDPYCAGQMRMLRMNVRHLLQPKGWGTGRRLWCLKDYGGVLVSLTRALHGGAPV